MIRPRILIENIINKYGVDLEFISHITLIHTDYLYGYMYNGERLNNLDRMRLMWIIDDEDTFDKYYTECLDIHPGLTSLAVMGVSDENIAYVLGMEVNEFRDYLLQCKGKISEEFNFDLKQHILDNMEYLQKFKYYIVKSRLRDEIRGYTKIDAQLKSVLKSVVNDTDKDNGNNMKTSNQNEVSLKEEIRKLNGIISSYKNELSAVQKELSALEKISTYKDMQITNLQNRIYNIEDSKESEQSTVEQLQSELHSAKSLINSLQQQLSAKVGTSENVPLIYKSDDELFEGEQRMLILDSLYEYMKQNSTRVRRCDIISSILKQSNFDEEELSDLYKKLEEDLINGADNPTNFTSLADKIPFEQERRSKHHKLLYGNDSRYPVTLCASCSDYRGFENQAHIIRKSYL